MKSLMNWMTVGSLTIKIPNGLLFLKKLQINKKKKVL